MLHSKEVISMTRVSIGRNQWFSFNWNLFSYFYIIMTPVELSHYPNYAAAIVKVSFTL